MNITELLKDIDNMIEVLRNSTHYRGDEVDPYMQGLYNGMEFVRSLVAKQEPVFIDTDGTLDEDAMRRNAERYI